MLEDTQKNWVSNHLVLGNMKIVSEIKPFTQVDYGKSKLRTFSESVEESDLKWHWDEEDRFVTVLHETDWKFQYDNQLPENLKPGKTLYIPKGEWHRLIKGTGDLKLSIEMF